MRFRVDGSEAMRIDSSGHLIAPYGITLGTAVGTYNAANTLDDYEEGTYTPAFTSSNFSATGVTSISDNSYTKIGDTVRVNANFVYSGVSGNFAAGDRVQLTGLPFTPDDYSVMTIVHDGGIASSNLAVFQGMLSTSGVTYLVCIYANSCARTAGGRISLTFKAT
jgi:hypothetical protein